LFKVVLEKITVLLLWVITFSNIPGVWFCNIVAQTVRSRSLPFIVIISGGVNVVLKLAQYLALVLRVLRSHSWLVALIFPHAPRLKKPNDALGKPAVKRMVNISDFILMIKIVNFGVIIAYIVLTINLLHIVWAIAVALFFSCQNGLCGKTNIELICNWF
jgi:hypothetical protein